MASQDKHSIPINLSDIREMVSEAVSKIIVSYNQLDESKKPAGKINRGILYLWVILLFIFGVVRNVL